MSKKNRINKTPKTQNTNNERTTTRKGEETMTTNNNQKSETQNMQPQDNEIPSTDEPDVGEEREEMTYDEWLDNEYGGDNQEVWFQYAYPWYDDVEEMIAPYVEDDDDLEWYEFDDLYDLVLVHLTGDAQTGTDIVGETVFDYIERALTEYIKEAQAEAREEAERVRLEARIEARVEKLVAERLEAAVAKMLAEITAEKK